MQTTRKIELIGMLLAIVASSASALGADSAERARQLQDQLAKVTSLDCSFSDMASGRWADGKPTVVTKPAEFKVLFTNINVDEGSAETPGNYGVSYIAVKYSGSYLHLMQQLRDGPLYTTSVLAYETSKGQFMAVHTRIEYSTAKVAGFTSEPEIYYGSCIVGTARADASAAPKPKASP
jgi:hypothetical protein